MIGNFSRNEKKKEVVTESVDAYFRAIFIFPYAQIAACFSSLYGTQLCIQYIRYLVSLSYLLFILKDQMIK